MGLRDVIDKSPVVPVAAVAVLLIALVAIAWSTGLISTGPEFGPRDVYYYDIGNNATFVASSDMGSPIEAPSGAEKGVRAYLYSCGECTPDEWFGYLEKYTQETQAQTAGQQGPTREGTLPSSETGNTVADNGQRIRPLDGDENDWISAMSDDGAELQRELMARCGGETPTFCTPGG